MYTSVSGIYENGQLTLNEPVPNSGKVPVIVTFLNDESIENANTLRKNQIRFGGLKGKISISDDFNEPLDDLKEYM